MPCVLHFLTLDFARARFARVDIIRLPAAFAKLQKPLAKIISSRRAPKSIAAYNSIGGGSPIVKYTNMQADLIKKSLKLNHNTDVSMYVGMRYWFPFTEQALEEIQDDGVTDLVILPLYPQFSVSTSGSSLRLLSDEFKKNRKVWGGSTTQGAHAKPPLYDDQALESAAAPAASAGVTPYIPQYGKRASRPEREREISHTVVPSWYNRPGYVNAMVGLITKELASFSAADLAASPVKHVLFSAHGVPQSYIDNGDPYQQQVEDCVDLISKLLPGDVEVHLSYQVSAKYMFKRGGGAMSTTSTY